MKDQKSLLVKSWEDQGSLQTVAKDSLLADIMKNDLEVPQKLTSRAIIWPRGPCSLVGI